MEHQKTHYAKTITSEAGVILVEGPVPPEQLATYTFHEGLKAFRPADKQQDAVVGIAGLPEGRIIIARLNDVVVGYVTYLYPDPMERWSEAKMIDLIELGAIEIAAPYRAVGLAKALLEVSFLDDAMNDYVVISTEYYWHWDLEQAGISVWDYKEVMKKIMGSVGMEVFATDDEEICSHPANMLMARIGSRVSLDSIEKFNQVRFTRRHMY